HITIESKSKIDIPTVHLHALLHLSTCVWRGLNSHRGLNVSSLETKHVLALTGINGCSVISKNASASGRLRYCCGIRSSVPCRISCLQRSHNILSRVVAYLYSPLQIALGDGEHIHPVAHLHF